MKNAAHLLPRQTLQKPQKKRLSAVIITKRYEEILQVVARLRYVTALDIARLLYTPTSLNHVREILSLLAGKKDYADRHYLFRFPLPNTRIGNTEKIYTLGSKGRSYLQSQGMSIDWYFRPYKVSGMSYQNCVHALLLTRFLIAAQMFIKQNPSWELVEMKTEYELKKEMTQEYAKQSAVTVAVKTNETGSEEDVMIIPDALLLLHNRTKKKARWGCLLPEIDRGTEYQRFFKQQIAARAEFLVSHTRYAKVFGTYKGVFAYVTTAGEMRRDSMRKWSKEVLTELGMKQLLSRFRFCSLSPSWEQAEQSIFLSPLWYTAVDKNPVALLS